MDDRLVHLPPMIYDSHVHIGKWNDGIYFSPKDVAEKLKKLGIKKWAVSSTSSIDNDFDVVKSEFDEMFGVAPEETVPILWVTPEMIKQSEDLSSFESIFFKGLKIHSFADKWDLEGSEIRLVMTAAKKRKLPIIIHTAWTPESEAGNYNRICAEFPDVKIVLAHGRPLNQTIQVMKENDNVYVDTAYMPEEDIVEISKRLGNDRILFGTDFPLDDYYYPDDNSTTRYKERVDELVNLFGEECFLTKIQDNFHKIFPSEPE